MKVLYILTTLRGDPSQSPEFWLAQNWRYIDEVAATSQWDAVMESWSETGTGKLRHANILRISFHDDGSTSFLITKTYTAPIKPVRVLNPL